jgi:hypothetical protein
MLRHIIFTHESKKYPDKTSILWSIHMKRRKGLVGAYRDLTTFLELRLPIKGTSEG